MIETYAVCNEIFDRTDFAEKRDLRGSEAVVHMSGAKFQVKDII